MMKLVEFDGVGLVWVSRMRLQTSTGVAIINLHDVESVNIEDLISMGDDRANDADTEMMVAPPVENRALNEFEPEYSLNVCLKSGKEYEVLLPSREAADKLLLEISRHLGF